MSQNGGDIMKYSKSTLALCTILACGQVNAELQALDEEVMGEFYGQAAPVVEMSGQVTFDAIVYTPSDGSPQEIVLPGQTSTDGAVATDQQLTFSGQMFGVPSTGSALDALFTIFPLRIGGVDTDNDGTIDRGAAMFSFQPNVGMGTGFSPLEIGIDDNTVNIKDQVFITNQGVLILNDALGAGTTFNIPGQTGDFGLTPVKYF